MAKSNTTSKTVTTYTIDKCSLRVVILTVLIILIIVLAGICVRFLVENPLSSIILIILICILCVLGVTSLTILEIRRRQAKKLQSITLRNGTTYYNIQPTAPVEDTSWQYSNRATLPA